MYIALVYLSNNKIVPYSKYFIHTECKSHVGCRFYIQMISSGL